MHFKSKFICLLILLANMGFCYANETPLTSDVFMYENQNDSLNNNFKQDYSSAVNKFENLNVQASYNDFERLINLYKDNDFFNILIGYKTAEFGFYNLSQLAFSNISDLEILGNHYNDVKQYYYPSCNIKKDDIIVLAELYSNIQYNDQVQESINELNQYSRFLYDYDYANYLMAYGYYKLNDITNAKKYIQVALKKNPNNITYLSLNAKILVGEKKGKLSKKILKDIESKKISSEILSQKIKATNEYINYSIARNNDIKDYYLGKYYYIEGDYNKALRILNSSSPKNKKSIAKNNGIIARCYYALGDYSNAKEYAKKSVKFNNTNCLLVLGDIEFKNGNYKSALNYYKRASVNKKYKKEALEKLAGAYLKLSNSKTAKDIYQDSIREFNNSYISNYEMSLIDKENELNYLKKTISINALYQDAWIDLAKIMIEKKCYKMAKRYLTIAKYIDENNFRYYYYQSLLMKK